jgi:branched-chain amino acid transport system ATP-binding protein
VSNASQSEPMLAVDGLQAGYGQIDVLHGVTLALPAGTLCAIVGANGAGKTTLLLAISAIVPKRAGTVRFDGADVTALRPHTLVRRGLVHVPEGRRMLAQMSVEENLQVAAAVRGRAGAAAIAGLFERFPQLAARRALPAGSLSGGEQQMLAIARALAAGPKVLLLDEPSMGLAPKLVDEIFEIIRAERERGLSILLVEQNARRALAIADTAYVMERGRIVLHGSGAELLADPAVTAAYLGGTGGNGENR